VAGYCEHGNELPSSVKGGEFFDYLNDFTFSRMTLVHRVIVLSVSHKYTAPHRTK